MDTLIWVTIYYDINIGVARTLNAKFYSQPKLWELTLPATY